ncbi:CD1845 family protein [Holdemanella biformis]
MIAFLISPYGLPKIAMWLVAYLEYGEEKLKEI